MAARFIRLELPHEGKRSGLQDETLIIKEVNVLPLYAMVDGDTAATPRRRTLTEEDEDEEADGEWDGDDETDDEEDATAAAEEGSKDAAKAVPEPTKLLPPCCRSFATVMSSRRLALAASTRSCRNYSAVSSLHGLFPLLCVTRSIYSSYAAFCSTGLQVPARP